MSAEGPPELRWTRVETVADIRSMLYLLLKLLHVLVAMVAVGANVTCSLWIATGDRP